VTPPFHLALQRRSKERHLELLLDVPSDLALVGPAVELLVGSLPPRTLSPRRISFNLRTALAEALCNAIAYGNRHDRTKFVHVRVVVAQDHTDVHISDDGDGFDPSVVPDPTRPENREREDGRGLFVLQHLVDHVSFNEKGNAICLTLRAG
jgi:serine/threonine-protein kinase RsbW